MHDLVAGGACVFMVADHAFALDVPSCGGPLGLNQDMLARRKRLPVAPPPPNFMSIACQYRRSRLPSLVGRLRGVHGATWKPPLRDRTLGAVSGHTTRLAHWASPSSFCHACLVFLIMRVLLRRLLVQRRIGAKHCALW